jgi:succinate dehydrogenase/fumarate reductase flavoprotein subunit
MMGPSTGADEISLHADVLVLGGGPAGTWAALTAARAGATVVLADKGYCGTSGAAAASNNNVWYVENPAEYERHFAERFVSGGYLSERDWTAALLERVVHQLHLLGELGYPFPRKENGTPNYATLRGPDYMRFMRQQIRRAGVSILDHAPMLDLLRDQDEGRVTGARGVTRDGAPWRVTAAATVVATGGCAFLGGALGTNVCTGDGHLAAGEAGVSFSGMEFSNQYGLAAAFSSVTKGLPFVWASYSKEDGSEIAVEDEEAFVSVARVLVYEPVYAVFDRATRDIERWLRSGQANAFLPYDRMGIDPFRERFPVGLRLEGTVRGTGGIRLTGRDCATGVPGLYAAGDAASREPVVGGRSGGGSPNAAWAIVTGAWAGEAASAFAASGGAAPRRRASPHATLQIADPDAARDVIEREVWSLRTNVFRDEAGLVSALRSLTDASQVASTVTTGAALAQARSASAMLYVARLAYTSALQRRESRALHQRTDYPERSGHLTHRQIIAGTDTLTVTAEEAAVAAIAIHEGTLT